MKKRFVLLIILFLAVVPVMAELKDSTNEIFEPSTKLKVAFISKRDGNFDIYTINEDGTELKRLTNSKVDELKPQWSPDGSKIMYLSKKGKKYTLYIMNNDGSNKIKLYNDCNIQYPPMWSPDGNKILFVAKIKSKNMVLTIDTDGENLANLTEAGTENAYPSWSPDGTKILYKQRYLKETYLYSMNADGTEQKRLTRDNEVYYFPCWSSDGQKISYIKTKRSFKGVYNKICIMDADGSNNLEIADASKKLEDIDYFDELYWSPDGTTFAFNKVADVNGYMSETGKITYFYKYGIYLVSADGNGYVRELAKTGENRVSPNWSPDSSKLAFLNNSKLIIYNMKTKMEDEINVGVSVPLSNVKWSPNGKKLIFAGKNHAFQKSGIYIVELDGKVTKLTENNDYDPVWAPVKEMWDVGSEMLEEK